MCDATFRSIDDMGKWPYTDKYEMKEIGATLNQMRDKFLELSILGISKMVEDFFNNLEQLGEVNISIWDSTLNTVAFSHDVRLIRHIGNVIKHNNSYIDSSTGGRSVKALISEYGFSDETPIQWLSIFKKSVKDSIFRNIYKTNQFCFEILHREGAVSDIRKILPEDEIVPFLYKFYIHSIPGHPERVLQS